MSSPPRILIAHPDTIYRSRLARQLQNSGWAVYEASDGIETRALCRCLEPTAVLLDANLPGESGWLLSAKLSWELPACTVILIADWPTSAQARFASFVGATALVSRNESLAAVLRETVELPIHRSHRELQPTS